MTSPAPAPPPPPPTDEEIALSDHRSMMLVATGAIVACWGVDWLLTAENLWLATAVRGTWAALSFVIWWFFPDMTPFGRRAALRLFVGFSPAALVAISAAVAPLPNGIFYWLIALPPVVTLIIREDTVGVAITILSTVALGVLGLAVEGQPVAKMLVWAGLVGTSGAFAISGSRFLGFIQARQRALEEQRLSTLRQLALSERRRADSERLAFVGQLAAGVAHEINNPLSFALANVRHLLERGHDVDPAEQKVILSEAHLGLDRIRQIVADLKTFARKDAEGLQPVRVKEAVDDALRLASVRVRGSDVQVKVAIADDLPEVHGERRRMSQILVNLFINAIDALEEARVASPQLTVHSECTATALRLHVDDNGPGIPPHVLARLFEPFFTTKAPGRGTGLGLALSCEYATRLGGTLSAANRAEGGARFTLELPLASAEAAAA